MNFDPNYSFSTEPGDRAVEGVRLKSVIAGIEVSNAAECMGVLIFGLLCVG